MSQTILAILSMLLVTLLALSQHRSMQHARQGMLDDELEVMASGIALQVMEYVGAKAFDDATEGGATVSSPSAMTDAPFASGNKCDLTAPIQTGTNGYADCNDLDDFNGMVWEPLPFLVDGDTLWFEVSASVCYIDGTQQCTNTKTFNKEVTVEVRDIPQHGRPHILRHNPIRLPRTFSYP